MRNWASKASASSALLWCIAVPGPCPAAEARTAVAVLASGSTYYAEALEGFRETFGGPVTAVVIGDARVLDLPRGDVFAAFGGKAAAADYPRSRALVVCMAPGWEPPGGARPGPLVQVAMTPSPQSVLAELERLRPGWSLLAIPWMSEKMGRFVSELGRSAGGGRVRVTGARLRGPADLPDVLRKFKDLGVDSIWLPPDPALVKRAELRLVRDFAAANGISFFVPSYGLSGEGSDGLIAVTFRDMGREAGRAAREALEGQSGSGTRYPVRSGPAP